MEIPWKPCLTSPAKVAVGGYTLRFPAYDSTSCNTDWLLIWQRIVRYIPHWVPFFRRSQVFVGLQEEHDLPQVVEVMMKCTSKNSTKMVLKCTSADSL